MNIKLYAVTHKEIETVLPERTLIGVGNNRNINGVSIYDNTGDNIAEKNQSFCELTALYWIWKNDKSDVVGLEHYRRQFTKNGNLLSKAEVAKILKKVDVIVPKPISCTASIYRRCVEIHGEDDLLDLRSVIEEVYPDYVADFDYLKQTNKIHICNMFIANREFVNDYCKWLFDILFTLEQRIDLTNRDSYQIRVFGFLAERLLNVYLHHNESLRIREIKIINPSEKYDSQVFSLPWDAIYYAKKLVNYRNEFR